MKLYFATGSCSTSPHIVLQELGLPYELVRVDMHSKKTSTGKDYLAVNPKGYVPALELDKGDIITEGPVIIQYLADQKPEAKLAAAAGTLERVRLQEWLNFITGEIHSSFGPLFNPAMPEAAREIFTAKLTKRLGIVEAALKENDYLLGSSFTIADAFLFAILSWLPLFKIDTAPWPSTATYLKKIEARPSVAAARAREAEVPKVQ